MPTFRRQVEVLKNPRQTLVIPEEALVPQGDKQFVLVVDPATGNKVERREVRIGARRPGQAEVLAGLAAGERVITEGTVKVRPGQAVEIRALDDGSGSLRSMLEVGAARPTAE